MKNDELVKWGDELYSYPNQLGAIKRSYRYLVGSGTGLTVFIRELEAIPDVRYKPSLRSSCVLYRTEAVFDLFKSYTTTAKVLAARRIGSLEELVFRMESSEC